jgi:hypothetical protein
VVRHFVIVDLCGRSNLAPCSFKEGRPFSVRHFVNVDQCGCCNVAPRQSPSFTQIQAREDVPHVAAVTLLERSPPSSRAILADLLPFPFASILSPS